MKVTEQNCPCGHNAAYTNCCGLLHQGLATAQTAEQLMRSRYCAYHLKQIDYLIETTHPENRSPNLRQSITDWVNQVEFYQLEILSTWQGRAADKVGKVEFKAHYRHNGKQSQMHEISRFKRYQKRWVYVDGEFK